MTSKEIRRKYLEFFASKGHSIVPSAPMVIKNDPTLMFTNAGMNQFKDIFLGNATPKFKRATDSQKCLRVSGKHNDLEVVGHDGYHHTMFEMLGNWSFGDYFKKEAISWAWELLTEVYKIDKDLLYATVFEGSAEDGTSLDEEARQTWLSLMDPSHVILGNKHDNFWEMGDTGPCGPSSEIHIDLRDADERAAVPGASLVNADHPLVIEIWNLVFMQFNRKADGSLEPLPKQNIDTGMGFERLCMVLQGKKSNYDTDVFTPLISKIEELTGHKYGSDSSSDVAMRVVADHVRAIAFAIADGQLPSNVKAGYVIRRILRRAVRYGYTFLGTAEPFLCRLVDTLAEQMGDAYPELVAQKQLIQNVIREEEQSFLRTLDRGIKLLDDIMAKTVEGKTISGKDAFLLYDTYGFPIDLTSLIATEKGYIIDMDGFQKELGAQKDRARAATSNEFGDWVEFGRQSGSEFIGYDFLQADARLLKHRTVKQKNKTLYQLVFDKTPFYAEMGGQVGDTGFVTSASGEKIAITGTVKENDLTIQLAERIPEDCEGLFHLEVDAARRQNIARNHTATHLLDTALREILGTHVEQKGSFVGPDYLRFDFSHFAKVDDEQLIAVERRVNELIRSNFTCFEKRDATMDEAKGMGAIALFGEKYGDKVRVVGFGPSTELCGGTHCGATGEIGFFKIVSESAIASGVRRIEAVSGEGAERLVSALQTSIKEAKAFLGNAQDLKAAIAKTIEENDKFKKEIEGFMQAKAADIAHEAESLAEQIGDVKVIRFREEADPAIVRNAATLIQKHAKGLVFAAAFAFQGKPQLLLMYSDDLVASGKNAGKDIREAAKLIQGGGGGQPSLANAGGRSCENLPAALERMVELATS